MTLRYDIAGRYIARPYIGSNKSTNVVGSDTH